MTHVAVIGAYGSAGVAVADALVTADADLEVTLADDGEPGGGLCILRGCMPSKEVLSAAAHRFQVRHDHRLPGDTPAVDLETVVETKDDHVADFAAHRRKAVHQLADRDHVEFLRDSATFVDDRTIRIGDREIDPDYVVVATGSEPTVPDLPGIQSVDFMTSADVLDATSFPESGVVMGFGYVGLELVPYITEVGDTDLTVIEHDARPLDEADPAFGAELLRLYEEQFDIEVLTETREERLETTAEGGVRLHTDREDDHATVEADQLFLFTGRHPAVSGLELDRAGIEPGPGWVRDTLQTEDNDHVFVVGDANGIEPILHVAKEQGALAADNILAHDVGKPLESYETLHHHVIFSGLGVVPYARVGHSVETAAEAGYDTVTATREARTDGVFRTKDVPHGLARLVVDATDGTVLGYQGLHYHADVMAKTMQVIVEEGMTVEAVPARAYHPTTPEIVDGLIRETRTQLDIE